MGAVEGMGPLGLGTRVSDGQGSTTGSVFIAVLVSFALHSTG